jgi:isochorismate synthase EntC
MPNRNTLPSNGQDTPAASKSDEEDDRDDNIMDEEEEEPSTDTASSSHDRVKHDFTFMGGNNDETSAAFDQISKFTSVEQYREFLEKELGEERLMKAYPKLKEFVSYQLLSY